MVTVLGKQKPANWSLTAQKIFIKKIKTVLGLAVHQVPLGRIYYIVGRYQWGGSILCSGRYYL